MKSVRYIFKRNKSYAKSQDGLQSIRTKVFFLGILMAFSMLLLGAFKGGDSFNSMLSWV